MMFLHSLPTCSFEVDNEVDEVEEVVDELLVLHVQSVDQGALACLDDVVLVGDIVEELLDVLPVCHRPHQPYVRPTIEIEN